MPNLHDLWHILRQEPFKATNDVSLRMYGEAVGVRLYAGLERNSNSPLLVLEIPKSAKPKEWSHASTSAFDAQAVALSGLPSGRIALSIKLKDSRFEDLFALLGEDIIKVVETASDEVSAVRSVVRQIGRWRKFLERGKRHLTGEEVRGLLGELAVLGQCIVKYGPGISLSAWQHDGGLRDFEFPSFAVEVKTYQAASGAEVRINDPAQLEPATGRPLYLAAIQLSLAENTGWSLSLAVNQVNNLLAENVELHEKFFDSLALQGYLPAHAEQYPERYLISPAECYLVSDGFPRITSASVPLGLKNVVFSIQLASLGDFKVQTGEILGVYLPLE